MKMKIIKQPYRQHVSAINDSIASNNQMYHQSVSAA